MFSLNETTLLSAINSGSIFSLLNSALSPSWSIKYNKIDASVTATTGQAVFSPTGWISAEPVSDSMVVNSNIEGGSYASYNKVRRPSELRVKFALEGWSAFTGALPNLTNFSTLSVSGLLELLTTMKNTACTYDIETPDRVYTGYDLIHFDHAKTAKNGQTLLIVSATFQEIMDVGEVTLSSASSSAQPSKNSASSRPGGISTDITQSSAKAVTLDDVKNAWSSGTTSLSDALATTGSGIVSGVNSAATSVSQAWSSASSSVATQIKNGVSEFVKVVL